ncbi:MAG: aldo/keto reductase [Clostridia bacterium]|nr:aldo/keto reductase [Clostridia bacterium]
MLKDLKSAYTLRNGVEMPGLGLGVWKVEDEKELIGAVHAALDVGYIHIDTAAVYGNEQFVGKAVETSGVKREDLFITTKLWNSHHRFDDALRAFDDSMKKLRTDYADLYLIHWPTPRYDDYVEAWRALIRLSEEKRVRAIGVCNFKPAHLERLEKETGIVPAVVQVECHPLLQQTELLAYCREKGIRMEAYSPLLTGHLDDVAGSLEAVAKKHGKTPAQVCIRFQIERGVVVIPKSVHANRIAENADVFDFSLDEEDMKAIAALNRDHRFLPDPDTMNYR